MKFVCPHCTREIKAEEAQLTGEWVELVKLAAGLGKDFRLANLYAEHFRAASGRMTIGKKVEILGAVFRLVEDGRFGYGGKHYRADRRDVLQAMRTTIDSTEPPLKNHNYLKAILAKSAEKLSAAGESAAEEQAREDRRGQRTEDRRQTIEKECLDPEENKRRMQELSESLFKEVK